MYSTGHEVKSFKEYNIPLRNNKCDLYRTGGRMPATDNAWRHAKGQAPRCCDTQGNGQGGGCRHLEEPGGATEPKEGAMAAKKSGWSLD